MPDSIDPSILSESDKANFGINGEPIAEDVEVEESEIEKEAMKKLLDIGEIFFRDNIFISDRNKKPKLHTSLTFEQKLQDLDTVQNYFHHVGSNNFKVLSSPEFRSVSPYPHWWESNQKMPGAYFPGKESEIADQLDISIVLSSAATNRARENKPSWYGDQDIRMAEAFIDKTDVGNPEIISGIIIHTNLSRIHEPYDAKAGEALSEEEYQKIRESLESVPAGKERIKAWQELIEYRPVAQEVLLSIIKRLVTMPNVPVLDNDGNLLWPKQMSYDEVKALAAERDNNKVESSPNPESQEETS
jgi:hypothetical protein